MARGRHRAAEGLQGVCDWCGSTFTLSQRTQRFCPYRPGEGGSCRTQYHQHHAMESMLRKLLEGGGLPGVREGQVGRKRKARQMG